MASQDNLGRLVLGDSHEYGDTIEPFDTQRIDVLILRELNKILQLPNWSTIDSHWHVSMPSPFSSIAEVQSPEPGVTICTGLGGAGMTLSFGVAKKIWRLWNGENA